MGRSRYIQNGNSYDRDDRRNDQNLDKRNTALTHMSVSAPPRLEADYHDAHPVADGLLMCGIGAGAWCRAGSRGSASRIHRSGGDAAVGIARR